MYLLPLKPKRSKADKINENILREWKKSCEIESNQLYKKVKIQAKIANDLNSLVNVSPEKVKSILEKHKGLIDSIQKESRTHYREIAK